MPPYKLFSTARSYSLSMVKTFFTPHGNILPIQFHTRISNFMFQKSSTLTLIFLRSTFIHIQVSFFFFIPRLIKYNIFFTSIHCANNTRPSHYHISHYIFYLTFRDYCGINLLLGHQYGSHYLYLNLKNLHGYLVQDHCCYIATSLTMETFLRLQVG